MSFQFLLYLLAFPDFYYYSYFAATLMMNFNDGVIFFMLQYSVGVLLLICESMVDKGSCVSKECAKLPQMRSFKHYKLLVENGRGVKRE